VNHTPLKHAGCEEPYCCICEGGLIQCTICGGAEGSLPKHCPGTKMTPDQEESVYAGRLDFVDGAWVGGGSATIVCRSCAATSASELTAVLFGWVHDTAGWVCRACEHAPRCPRPECDRVTTARGVLCAACASGSGEGSGR